MTTMLLLLLVAGCSDEPGEETSVRASLSSDKKALEFHLGKDVTMKLVRIEAGNFTMGSPDTEKDRSKDEGPQREVTVSRAFYMGVTEVTQAQWKAMIGTEPWSGETYAKSVADHAASDISWDDATAFCKALSKNTGKTVRLPTEAEWEYACRAGSKTRFSFGDEDRDLSSHAWYSENSDNNTHPVGKKKPNAWGLYDMHGNVYEWCSDWYGKSYVGLKTKTTNPQGLFGGEYRVLRGGSWDVNPRYCRSAARDRYYPGDRDCDYGFRVVVSAGVD